jgi:hypothetical protein
MSLSPLARHYQWRNPIMIAFGFRFPSYSPCAVMGVVSGVRVPPPPVPPVPPPPPPPPSSDVSSEEAFIWGRSKMSRTEKLDVRGILISSNLEEKEKRIIIASRSSLYKTSRPSLEGLINWKTFGVPDRRVNMSHNVTQLLLDFPNCIFVHFWTKMWVSVSVKNAMHGCHTCHIWPTCQKYNCNVSSNMS